MSVRGRVKRFAREAGASTIRFERNRREPKELRVRLRGSGDSPWGGSKAGPWGGHEAKLFGEWLAPLRRDGVEVKDAGSYCYAHGGWWTATIKVIEPHGDFPPVPGPETRYGTVLRAICRSFRGGREFTRPDMQEIAHELGVGLPTLGSAGQVVRENDSWMFSPRFLGRLYTRRRAAVGSRFAEKVNGRPVRLGQYIYRLTALGEQLAEDACASKE
jgi:hypothetical protein